MHYIKASNLDGCQMISIPAELAYDDKVLWLQIERIGDELRIRPVSHSPVRALNRLASFASDFLAEGRGEETQSDREGQ